MKAPPPMMVTDPMPIAVARRLVRAFLTDHYERAGTDAGRDMERAIQALMDDAVARAMDAATDG